MNKKYVFSFNQMVQIVDHLNHLNFVGIDAAKQLVLVSAILENPEEIIEGGEDENHD